MVAGIVAHPEEVCKLRHTFRCAQDEKNPSD